MSSFLSCNSCVILMCWEKVTLKYFSSEIFSPLGMCHIHIPPKPSHISHWTRPQCDPLTHCDGGKFSFKVIPTLKPPIPPLLSHYLSKKRKNATFPALLWEKRAINHSWHEWHTMSHMSEPMALQYSIHSITWLQSMGGAKNSPFHLAMTQIVCDADAICVG